MPKKIGESAGKLPQGDHTEYTLARQQSDMRRKLLKPKKLQGKINPKWSVSELQKKEEEAKEKEKEYATRSALRPKGDDYDTSHGAMLKRQESYENRIKKADAIIKSKGGKRRRKSRKRKRKTGRKRRRTRRKSRRRRKRRTRK